MNRLDKIREAYNKQLKAWKSADLNQLTDEITRLQDLIALSQAQLQATVYLADKKT